MTSLLDLSLLAVQFNKAVEKKAEECGGDITDFEPMLTAWWDSLQAPIEDKCEGCTGLSFEWEAAADAQDKVIEKLKAKSEANRKRAKRIREYMRDCLQLAGIKKVKAGVWDVWVQANGGKEHLEVLCPPEALPLQYQTVETVVSIKPNVEALRAALAKGEAIESVKLHERGYSLRIR